MTSPAIARLQAGLVADLEAICATRAAERAVAMLAQLGAPARTAAVARPRRKAPIQLCPAPGCANRAAPVFGMVCAAHKDADKATVESWRAARRNRKAR